MLSNIRRLKNWLWVLASISVIALIKTVFSYQEIDFAYYFGVVLLAICVIAPMILYFFIINSDEDIIESHPLRVFLITVLTWVGLSYFAFQLSPVHGTQIIKFVGLPKQYEQADKDYNRVLNNLKELEKSFNTDSTKFLKNENHYNISMFLYHAKGEKTLVDPFGLIVIYVIMYVLTGLCIAYALNIKYL